MQKVQHHERECHREVNHDYADVQSDRLDRVKSYKRALVDQQEYETREPSQNVAKKAGHVFLKTFGWGSHRRHSR
jgi:hypothetical protein